MDKITLINVLVLVGISIGMSLLAYYITKRQNKYIKTLKVGDKVFYSGNGHEGVIIKKVSDNEFTIQLTVSGMSLSSYKRLKTHGIWR
jgi:preprotein translocase subunit YajC